MRVRHTRIKAWMLWLQLPMQGRVRGPFAVSAGCDWAWHMCRAKCDEVLNPETGLGSRNVDDTICEVSENVCPVGAEDIHVYNCRGGCRLQD